jgi:hypothetical protein
MPKVYLDTMPVVVVLLVASAGAVAMFVLVDRIVARGRRAEEEAALRSG